MDKGEIKESYIKRFGEKEDLKKHTIHKNEILTLMRISLEDNFDYLKEYLKDDN